MTGIVVITHDGRMPKDGGKRLGYMANGQIFPLPGISITVLRPEPVEVSGLVLADIPYARTWYNRCAHCDSRFTKRSIERLAGGGTKSLLKCEDCDKFTRDYDDR